MSPPLPSMLPAIRPPACVMLVAPPVSCVRSIAAVLATSTPVLVIPPAIGVEALMPTPVAPFVPRALMAPLFTIPACALACPLSSSMPVAEFPAPSAVIASVPELTIFPDTSVVAEAVPPSTMPFALLPFVAPVTLTMSTPVIGDAPGDQAPRP